MKIGVGLPSTIPRTTSSQVLNWARIAERHGFSTLGTLDRVVFDNYDPIPVLGAAAAVTEHIGLTTSILIGPYRGNGTILAKQLASVDRLSEGRLTVGIAVGTREDDYEATQSPYRTRGTILDDILRRARETWNGDSETNLVGPTPAHQGGPPLLIGGGGAAATRRVIQHGAGWISGGGSVEAFSETAGVVRTAWDEAGRDGSPRMVAIGYFALGGGAADAAGRYLGDYYGFSGAYAQQVIAGALTNPDAVQAAAGAFADAGCDELILFPCLPDQDQVDLLAAAAAAYLTPRT